MTLSTIGRFAVGCIFSSFLCVFVPQASKALDRRDDLQKLKAKLSFNREILHSADPASKPWLRKTSGAAAPIREIKDEVDAAAGGPRAAGRMDEMYSLHTASPAQVRVGSFTNLSRDTFMSQCGLL